MADTAPLVHATLANLWDHLRQWLDVVTLCGPYPSGNILLGEVHHFRHPETDHVGLQLPDAHVAAEAWRQFTQGDIKALSNSSLSRVLTDVGYLLGRRLGLDRVQSGHFGGWLASAITGSCEEHGNEDMIEHLDAVASRAAYGDLTEMNRAYLSPRWWDEYRGATMAVVETLKAEGRGS